MCSITPCPFGGGEFNGSASAADSKDGVSIMCRCLQFENVSQKLFIVLDPRFGDLYDWIPDWRLGIAASQLDDEVRLDSLFTVFGARRATRGPL